MTTKGKKQASTTPRKKKLTLQKETVRDLSVGDKAKAVRGGHPGGVNQPQFRSCECYA